MRNLFLILYLFAATATLVAAQQASQPASQQVPQPAATQQYDLVLEGGRVIDPETGLDAVRNVGIRNGKIASISAAPLSGRRVIHAAGLVVAPGFIDLHQHGQDLASQRVKAFDGVTTALEMEIGAPDVAQFLKSKEGRSLIHYGTSASHVAARAAVFGAPLPAEVFGPHAGIPEILPKSGPATDKPASPALIRSRNIWRRLRAISGSLWRRIGPKGFVWGR